MSGKTTTKSDLDKKSEKEIADGMAGCSIGDNDNGNGDEAKDKAAEPRRTVKPVQETTSQQVDKEPNKGDVSQNQSNPKTSACSKQSTSQTSGPVDWQFYLDTLAPHLSTDLDDLATYLKIEKGKLDSIRKDYTTEHEVCFHLLWAWRESGGNDVEERLRALHKALSDAGQKKLADKPRKTRSTYKFNGHVYNGTSYVVDGVETLTVANGIVDVHARFGRYFQLNEDDIKGIFIDNKCDSKKQAKEIIKYCIQRKLLCTRQELCDGLNYVEKIQLIEEMNKFWSQ